MGEARVAAETEVSRRAGGRCVEKGNGGVLVWTSWGEREKQEPLVGEKARTPGLPGRVHRSRGLGAARVPSQAGDQRLVRVHVESARP